jgi:hypothetical protein
VKVWPTFCKHCGQSVERGTTVCPACNSPIPLEQFESDATTTSDEVRRRIAVLEAKPAASSEAQPVPSGGVRRSSRLPVVEILVAVLLLGGAATAIWMLHSSLPRANTTASGIVTVTVSPATGRVAAGKTLAVAAAVSGSDDLEVNWSVKEGDAGGRVQMRGAKAAKGKVWSQAVYDAPSTPGTYHVLAASKADPTKSAVAAITVVHR